MHKGEWTLLYDAAVAKVQLQQAQQKHWYYQKIETAELLIYMKKFENSDQIEMMLMLS